MNIGFIGFGTMGAPMAGHLLGAGHRLLVWSRRPASADFLLAQGAIWCDSPVALASASAVSSLADMAALERFILEQLSPIPGVEKIRSSFALKQVRYKTALPLPKA